MRLREYFYKSIVFSLILNIIVFYTFAGCGGNKKNDGKKKCSCNGKNNPNSTGNSDANNDENNDKDNDENKKKSEEQKLKKRIVDIKNKFGLAKKIDSNFQDNNIENLDNVKTLTELDDLLKQGTDFGKKNIEAETIINNKKNELQNQISELQGIYDNIFTKLQLNTFGIKKKDFNLSLANFNEVADLNNINTNLINLDNEIKGIKNDFAEFFINEIENIIKTKEGFALIDFQMLLKKEVPNILNSISDPKLEIDKITLNSLDPLEKMLTEEFNKIICLEITKNEKDEIVLLSRNVKYKLSADKSNDKFTCYECDNVGNIDSLIYADDKGVTKFKKIYFSNKEIKIPEKKTFISYICKEGDNVKFFFIIKLTDDVEAIDGVDDDKLIKLSNFCKDASEIAVVDSCRDTGSFKCLFGNLESLKKIDFSNFETVCYGSLEYMFYKCEKLESLDLSNFNTSRVISMKCMFNGCTALESLDLSRFDTSRVTNISFMFKNCKKLKKIKGLNNFNTSRVINMRSMFKGCAALESLDLSNFNTSSVTSMKSMFYECSALKSLDLSKFDTTSVTTMESMFYECSALESLDLSNFNTNNVTTMESMFCKCEELESLNLSNFNTIKVESMQSMFDGCKKLKEIKGLNYFNTSNVTNMYAMFYECEELESLDLSNFKTTDSTNISYIFSGCDKLKKDNVKCNDANINGKF